MRKALNALFIAVLVLSPASAAEPAIKPVIKTAADGFPTGSDTPEGAACDLARSFIQHDPALLLAICIKPFGGDEMKKTYQEFLNGIAVQMKEEAKKTVPSPKGPKSIGKCFAARHLSKDGPASAGYAMFGFQDIMFVDVGVYLQDGKTSLCRTMMIKDKDGQWVVDPRPDLSPLLSMGLNEEPHSTKDFTDAYSTK